MTYNNNKTLYLHYLMMTPDVHSPTFKMELTARSQEDFMFFANSLPLIKYMKPYKESEMVNLMDSTLGDVPPPKTKED